MSVPLREGRATRLKMSAASKKALADPEVRAKMSAARRKALVKSVMVIA